jgi:hypothetical protein
VPPFVYHAKLEDLPWEYRINGTYRRVGFITDNSLAVWGELSADSPPPKGDAADVHPFDQLMFFIEGEFEARVGDETIMCEAGDSLYIPADVPHVGRVVSGPVKYLEIFAPIRTEYLYLCEHQTTFGVPPRQPDGTRVDERTYEDLPTFRPSNQF